MTFRELLDVPFALIQANLPALAWASALSLVTAELVILACTAGAARLTGDTDEAVAWAAILSTLACVWLLRGVLRAVTVAVGLASVAGAPIGWRTALRRAGAVAGPLLVFQLLYTLIGIGVLALSSPLIVTFPFGLLWLGRLRGTRFVAVPAMFIEQSPHRVAVARAKLLVAGAEWQTVGLWCVQRALLVLLAVPLLGIPWYLSDFSGTHRWAVIALLTSGALLIVAFGEVVEAATRVVSYIDRRCRREGLDIHVPGLEVRP
ncbi:hypothetical protein DFR70_10639 [Nocardia tenerifensis]|uniref:Glycerophosphoryl diester phosphodiesterase family protein n=2 Tax=Nocardia tenerifensis TaxID=228006 RepID=A0A318K1S3_9NOCA|nr:hypothetical protein [Nocardia tenerifensis]PXX62986.1 hypothetical protein DFR70_10639 [Nocardia tenerifensis]